MDLLDDNKTTVWRNLKKYKEFGLEALLQESCGGRHREYMTYEEEQAFLKHHIEAAQTGDSFFLIAGGCNTEQQNEFYGKSHKFIQMTIFLNYLNFVCDKL